MYMFTVHQSVHYLSKKVYTGKNIERNCQGAEQGKKKLGCMGTLNLLLSSTYVCGYIWWSLEYIASKETLSSELLRIQRIMHVVSSLSIVSDIILTRLFTVLGWPSKTVNQVRCLRAFDHSMSLVVLCPCPYLGLRIFQLTKFKYFPLLRPSWLIY